MTIAKDVFVKVSNLEDKLKIFHELCFNKSKVIAKASSPQAEIVALRAEICTGNEITFSVLDSIELLAGSSDIVVQFAVGDEKYLFSSPFTKTEKSLTVSMSLQLYHLQRREDFRLKLPTNYQVTFQIQKLNQSDSKLKAKVQDISGGGCRLFMTTTSPSLKVGDVLEGEIHLPDRPQILIKGEVRHLEVDREPHSLAVGLMFLGLTVKDRNRLAALVLDLYRQLYSRLN